MSTEQKDKTPRALVADLYAAENAHQAAQQQERNAVLINKHDAQNSQTLLDAWDKQADAKQAASAVRDQLQAENNR